MDVNEDIYHKSIGKALTMSEDLKMIEASVITQESKLVLRFLEEQSQLMASG